MGNIIWRGMKQGDLEDVFRIAVICYPEFEERDTVLAEKWQLSPESCFVLEDHMGVCGYILSHPWSRGSVPPLDTLLGEIQVETDVLYLHDIALLPHARRNGHAAKGIAILSEYGLSSGYHVITLVAVNGSLPFWQGQGFESVAPDPALIKVFGTYGKDAFYMVRERI